MKRYTIDNIMSLSPCALYTRERVEVLWKSREGLTLLEIADLWIPAEDRIWAICHLAGRRLRMRLGRAYAGHVYHLWAARFPEDSRVSACLAVIDRWLAGEASDAEVGITSRAADAAVRAADDVLAADAAAARAAAAAVIAAKVAAADADAAWDAAALAADAAAWLADAEAAEADAEAAEAEAYARERRWQLEETRRLLELYGDDNEK